MQAERLSSTERHSLEATLLYTLSMKFGTRHPAFMLVACFLLPSALAFTTPTFAMRAKSRSWYGDMRAHIEHQSASSAPAQVTLLLVAGLLLVISLHCGGVGLMIVYTIFFLHSLVARFLVDSKQ